MAGFIRRLPMYWRLDHNDYLRLKKGLNGLSLHANDDVYVDMPESVTAYINWRGHCLEETSSSTEAADFLRLSEGRSALVDIGAQTGFMSALFARSRFGPARIASFEPDPLVLPILERARERNIRDGLDWRIVPEAVSDRTGKITIALSNWLYESNGGGAPAPGTEIEAMARSLPDVVNSLGWTPDLIKIDVESFEYEILLASLELLGRIKPALQLEVHWEIMNARSRSAMNFLGPLADLGYRGITGRSRTVDDWKKAGLAEPVSRFSLCT